MLQSNLLAELLFVYLIILNFKESIKLINFLVYMIGYG
jgi:hypothetical protein